MQPINESNLPALIAECNAIVVNDNVSYKIAAEKRALVRQGIKYFTDLYVDRIAEAHEHHRNLIADRDKFVNQLKPVDAKLGGLLSRYDNEQERIRQAKEAEAKRIQKEKEDAERREQHQIAELLRSAGEEKAAQEIASKPIETKKVEIKKETPKVSGLSYRTDWKAEVFDLMAVAKAVVDGRAPLDAIQANRSFFNDKATELRTPLDNLWGGVKIFSVNTPVQRS